MAAKQNIETRFNSVTINLELFKLFKNGGGANSISYIIFSLCINLL